MLERMIRQAYQREIGLRNSLFIYMELERERVWRDNFNNNNNNGNGGF